MPTASCPLCGAGVTVRGRTKLGKRANCPGCAAELEVVSLDPLEFGLPYEDDWEEDREEDKRSSYRV